jgi:nucleotide-binding universal stress UspA family protein
MVLICYDGSGDAKAAVEQAGTLVKGQPVTVLTVWEPFVEVMARLPLAFNMPVGVDIAEIDAATRENAEQVSQEGAALARAAGLDAEPRTCAQSTTVATAILTEAQALSASAIVMGSRGLTGLRSRLLGSVSHALLQHADRAVIVVPSPDVARVRRHERQAAEASG